MGHLRISCDLTIFYLARNRCSLLVAYHHYVVGGGYIYLSIDTLENDLETENVLKWGYRLLYLEIFLFLITSMFYWEYPFTLPFAGAILAFLYVAQIWKHANLEDDGVESRESSMTVE